MKKLIGFFIIVLLLQVGFVIGQEAYEESIEGVREVGERFSKDNIANEDLKVKNVLVKFKKIDDKIELAFLINKKYGYLTYEKPGEDEHREYFYLDEKDSEFSFVDGEMTAAKFKVQEKPCTEDDCLSPNKPIKYKLGNYEYDIYPGSQVIFQIAENGNPDSVKIIQPEGKEVSSPKIIDPEGDKRINLEIVSEGDSGLNVPTGTFQSLEGNDGNFKRVPTSLFFSWENEKMRTFTKNKANVFLNDKGEVDFSVINLGDEMDIVFDSKNIDASKNTLLIQGNVVASISPNGVGPVVNIGSGNRFDVGLNKEGKISIVSGQKTLTYQGINGYAHLTKGENGENPLLRLQGESKYGPDRVSFTGRDGNFYYNPNANIAGVNHGKEAAALNVELFGKDNDQLGQVLLTNNENQHVMTPFSGLKGPAKYFVSDKGNVFSANAAFNLLTPESRRAYADIPASDQAKIYTQLQERGGVAALEISIKKFISYNNPLRSSVTLNGCSGTLVGFHNGKPMILTAAHCVRKGGRRNVYLKDLGNNFNSRWKKDRAISATVVEFSARGDGSDLALMELNPNEEQLAEIKKRGFSRIIPKAEAAKLKIGDDVMIIGCPSYTFYKEGCQIKGIDKTTGTNSLRTNLQPANGMSGGGLFKGRYLIGVTASGGSRYGGGFANPESIYKLLGNKYPSLYKIFLIVI